jgi:hypothetical protein
MTFVADDIGQAPVKSATSIPAQTFDDRLAVLAS